MHAVFVGMHAVFVGMHAVFVGMHAVFVGLPVLFGFLVVGSIVVGLVRSLNVLSRHCAERSRLIPLLSKTIH